jgi:hypothetical protein
VFLDVGVQFDRFIYFATSRLLAMTNLAQSDYYNHCQLVLHTTLCRTVIPFTMYLMDVRISSCALVVPFMQCSSRRRLQSKISSSKKSFRRPSWISWLRLS